MQITTAGSGSLLTRVSDEVEVAEAGAAAALASRPEGDPWLGGGQLQVLLGSSSSGSTAAGGHAGRAAGEGTDSKQLLVATRLTGSTPFLRHLG